MFLVFCYIMAPTLFKWFSREARFHKLCACVINMGQGMKRSYYMVVYIHVTKYKPEFFFFNPDIILRSATWMTSTIFLAAHAIVNVKNIKLNYRSPYFHYGTILYLSKMLYFILPIFTRLHFY